MSAYASMLTQLFAARRFGVRLGLDRMERALERLGHPERRLGPVVHIGGTNGKGSTSAMVEAMLRASGRRPALYTSPHLSRFTERFRVGGVEVGEDALAEQHARLARALAGGDELTFFELATLLGFLVFAAGDVDCAVLEVGLGGRLDATNVIDADVAVVTGVALEHEEILGPGIRAIAVEKAGIFKPGRIAVVGSSGDAAGRETLLAEARRRGVSELVEAGRGAGGIPLGLGGEHQGANAACALAAVDALERATAGAIVVGEPARRRALAELRWPGRLERIEGRPPLLLDAAHNPDGAQALGRELRAMAPSRLAVVVGVAADKDVEGLLAPIVPRAQAVIATEAVTPRALAAPALAAQAEAFAPGRVVAVSDPWDAVELARHEAGPDGLVVIYGSLFLVGPLRARLLGERVDPVTAQDPAPVRAREPEPVRPT